MNAAYGRERYEANIITGLRVAQTEGLHYAKYAVYSKEQKLLT